MTERSGALQEDLLYMSYAQIAAKSCGEEEEDGGNEEGGDEGEGGASIHVSFFFFNVLLMPIKTNQMKIKIQLKKHSMEKVIVSLYNLTLIKFIN